YTVIVVGSGLAGGSAAASMAELGYNVKCFCFQDSPRRAHSIAAQGGIDRKSTRLNSSHLVISYAVFCLKKKKKKKNRNEVYKNQKNIYIQFTRLYINIKRLNAMLSIIIT